jgi:hypothetical protein
VKGTRESEPSVAGITQAINSMAVTVSGVYLATHSVIVTALVTGSSTLLTAWAWWELRRRNQAHIAGEARGPRSRADPFILDADGSHPASTHQFDKVGSCRVCRGHRLRQGKSSSATLGTVTWPGRLHHGFAGLHARGRAAAASPCLVALAGLASLNGLLPASLSVTRSAAGHSSPGPDGCCRGLAERSVREFTCKAGQRMQVSPNFDIGDYLLFPEFRVRDSCCGS